MNAPNQDQEWMNSDTAIDASSSIDSQSDNTGKQTAQEIQALKAQKQRHTDKIRFSQDSLVPAYRTRWLAWSLITVGWVGSVIAALLRGGAVEWFMAAVLSMVAIISGLAPLLAAVGLSATRIAAKEQIREGEELEILFTLKRSFVVPLVWVAIHEQMRNESSLTNWKLGIRAVLTSMFHKEMSYRYSLHKLRRGKHAFEYVEVTVGDWLGLTAIRKQLVCRSSFLVLPGLPHGVGTNSLDHLEGTGLYAVPAKMMGEAQDHRGEAGLEEIEAAVHAAGLGPDSRPFRQGDSLRHLDWRSAARGRGLQTKTHAMEQNVQICIAVDTLASGYDDDDLLFDACVGWAALAVSKAVLLGNGVTLLLGQGDHAMPSMHTGGSRTDLTVMQQAMAMLRAEGKGSLARSLHQGTTMLVRGSTILVFTADWRGGRNWGELAGFAAEKGCKLELFIVTRNNVPTFAMREQHKWLDSGGVKLTWLPVLAGMAAEPYAEEGGHIHEPA
ncbi:DUF58 domain-containing protein [Paenibacillus sinopodophylli]|uniref:DUF58 domain-containing protein n=1 Tax=Paenibacillus sinopodophylli TaxID=1837342 RepID=UPI00110CE344|nr:DUF58 domain-containing protein [Paenibacillus sinopodophylli]